MSKDKTQKKDSKAEQEKTLSPGLRAQRAFVKAKETEGLDFSLVVAGAFVRGIRDIGYKSTGFALNELIDNSVQAEASQVHVAFGFTGTSTKPSSLAIIDDGHGMDPTMIRMSTLWGGTHRENDRDGFGRYGYGLPSACVSQGEKYTVYSQTEDSELHSLTIDIKEIGEGKYSDTHGRVVAPEPKEDHLPGWVQKYIDTHLPNRKHGTVVLIERLDRIDFSTRDGLERHLMENFGVAYQNYLVNTPIYVHGQKVDPIDPLFITPGFRFHEIPGNPIASEALEPMEIKVKSLKDEKVVGTVTVRFSYLPPGWQSVPEDIMKERPKLNARGQVRKEYNGILVLRNGRLIDVVTGKCPWTTIMTYDRNVGIEINFPPCLDEDFSITTSKQQVVLSKRIWDILKQAGVYKAFETQRGRYKREASVMRAKREEHAKEKRASEQAMEEAGRFKPPMTTQPSVEEQKAQETKVEAEAQKHAEVTGGSVTEAKKAIVEAAKKRPYKVRRENLPGAPFFRLEQLGGQKILWLNTAHRFFTDLYAAPDSNPRLRAGLEVLLFVIGDTQTSATGDRKVFYEVEAGEWSKHLSVALERLSHINDVDEEQPDGHDAEAAAGVAA